MLAIHFKGLTLQMAKQLYFCFKYGMACLSVFKEELRRKEMFFIFHTLIVPLQVFSTIFMLTYRRAFVNAKKIINNS